MTNQTSSTSSTTKTITCPCPRCDGKGYINGYSHICGGRCFKCGGSGTVAATKRNIAAVAAAKEPLQMTLSKKIATELHIRAGYGGYVGYSEDSLLAAIDKRNKEQFKADFAAYLAENVTEFFRLAGLA